MSTPATEDFADLGAVLVVVPTYQEAETVGPVLARLRAAVPEAHALVVDDNSPDGTGAVAERLTADDPHVHVLHRPVKAGLGSAYVAGFGWGLEQGFDVLVEMDADGSHPPEQLPRLLGALRHADLTLGSRYVPGGQVVNWPAHREALSRAGNTYARLLLGLPLHDATGGFRAYRRGLLESVELADVASEGYCFQVDLAWRAVLAGARVVEVPITFVERTEGASKMTSAIVREALWRVTVWGLIHRGGQARRLLAGTGGRGA
ncbi:MAG TPA: polyprenol monophosphomannose synthase [Jiangellales bacterium]|nr:polyprenol monophosphomannose synthase [Jiangellales bacterium]